MNYKKTYEYYHSVGIATKQEREHLNGISDSESFAAQFQKYARLWAYKKSIRHNRFNKDAADVSKSDTAKMREFLLSNPNLITDRLRGKTEAERLRIKQLDRLCYNQCGIASFYDEIYNQNQDEKTNN